MRHESLTSVKDGRCTDFLGGSTYTMPKKWHFLAGKWPKKCRRRRVLGVLSALSKVSYPLSTPQVSCLSQQAVEGTQTSHDVTCNHSSDGVKTYGRVSRSVRMAFHVRLTCSAPQGIDIRHICASWKLNIRHRRSLWGLIVGSNSRLYFED